MDITKETLLECVENMWDNLGMGRTQESTVELTALGARVKLNLSSLAYGAIIFLNGVTWFKEGEDMWSSNAEYLSQLELAQSIRSVSPEDAVFLYNGEVYR